MRHVRKFDFKIKIAQLRRVPFLLSIMNNLPKHVCEYITNHLNGDDLMEFSRVSRLFHSLMQEECLWKRICVEEFKIKPDITWRKQSWKKLYISLRNPKIYTFSYDLYYDEDSTNMRSERQAKKKKKKRLG